MNQRFEEDRAELEAHFQERVQAYIELGETPEQAQRSAQEKFGEVEATLRTLQQRQVLRSCVRPPLGVFGIGLLWGFAWATLFAALLSLLQLFLPFDSDVGTLRIVAIIAWVGFVSGSVFGALLSLVENGKAIRDLSLGRMALLGTLSAALFPLLTNRADQTFWTCPFGAAVGMALLTLAKRAEAHGSKPLTRLRDVCCACVLLPMHYAIQPRKRTVRR